MLLYSTALLILTLPLASADSCVKYVCSVCTCLESSTPLPSATTTSELPSTTSTGPVDLIVNGGFELDYIDPWIYSQGTGGARIWRNEDTNDVFPSRSRSGEHLLYFSNLEDWLGNVVPTSMSQRVSLVSGTQYIFTAYYSILFMPLTTTICHLNASMNGIMKAEAFVDYSKLGDPYTFKSLTFDYTASDTGVSTASITITCDDATVDEGGLVGLDDISLIEVTTTR